MIFPGVFIVTIRVNLEFLGSSTALGVGVKSEEAYPFLIEKMEHSFFIIHNLKRGRLTNFLREYPVDYLRPRVITFYILHFRADEYLDTSLNKFGSKFPIERILRFYNERNHSRQNCRLGMRITLLFVEILLFAARKVTPLVSGRNQIFNYKEFFARGHTNAFFVLILDSRVRSLRPFLVNCLRIIRAHRVKSHLKGIPNILIIDYKDLQFTRRMFAEDGMHLSCDGHERMALKIIEVIEKIGVRVDDFPK